MQRNLVEIIDLRELDRVEVAHPVTAHEPTDVVSEDCTDQPPPRSVLIFSAFVLFDLIDFIHLLNLYLLFEIFFHVILVC